MLLSEGQMSDYKGAALMLPVLPKARELLGDKGYDADWFRQALAERGINSLHTVQIQSQEACQPRPRTLSPAAQDREHVRKAQGLAAHSHSLRPMRPHLHVRHLNRGHSHFLALINES